MITFKRLYHITRPVFNLKKQGMKLNRMINPKTKRNWYPAQQPFEEATLPSVKSLTKVKHEPGKRGIRRIAMLNKMFMKQITDIMSTGTVSMNIVGRGIEISKVKITPDMQTVNVFWVCKGDVSDKETEAVLQNVAGALRHELSTLRVMGEVPYIVFVKDKQEALLVDLDRRLREADYGEDYTLTEIGHLLKTEFVLNTKLSPEMKAKIKLLEEESPLVEEPLPEMTHNVFGLDHARIMNRLIAARKKTRDAWSNFDNDSAVISYRAPSQIADNNIDHHDQKKELAEFLLKRQIQQNKLHKQLRDNREQWLLAPDSNDDDTAQLYDDKDDDDYYEDDDDDDYYEEEEMSPQPLDKNQNAT